MMRWRKPPILPCEYALAAASSMRRIASICRYSGASSAAVVCVVDGSSASIRFESGVDMDAVTTRQTIQLWIQIESSRPGGIDRRGVEILRVCTDLDLLKARRQ